MSTRTITAASRGLPRDAGRRAKSKKPLSKVAKALATKPADDADDTKPADDPNKEAKPDAAPAGEKTPESRP